MSVRTPTYTCDTTQADTAYWVGITGASGTCPYPQFAQAGWVMLNVPTSFYEEFNANLQPCDSGPIYGSSVSGTPTYQVNARIVGSFYCSSRSMTDFWVNGAGLGSVCSDWQYGKNVQVFAERREDNSRLASMSFTGLKYCTGDNQADCAPGIAYSVQTSASQPEDPCGIYTWLGTSSFSIKDKRDNGVTSC